MALIVILWCQATPSRAFNLVPNPSVEQVDPEDSDRPLNWEPSTEGDIDATFTHEQDPDSGQRSLRVEVVSSNAGDAKWISAPFSIPSSGTRYILSNTYRCNVASDLLVHVLDIDGSDRWILVTNLAPVVDWTVVSKEVYIPRGTTAVRVLHLISEVGWLETDDYSLQEKSADSAMDSGIVDNETGGTGGRSPDASSTTIDNETGGTGGLSPDTDGGDEPPWEPTVYQHGELAGSQQPDSGSIRVPQTTGTCSVHSDTTNRDAIGLWLLILASVALFIRRFSKEDRFRLSVEPLRECHRGPESIDFEEETIRTRHYFFYERGRKSRISIAVFNPRVTSVLLVLYMSTSCDPTDPVSYSQVESIVSGDFHNCALLHGGKVRCWGQATMGQLGYGNKENIGDDEYPASAGNVDIGGRVVQLSAGKFHTCALLEDNRVRCWGHGFFGQLGYGNTQDIGDDETPKHAGDVDIDATVVQLAAGGLHTCVLLDTGSVRCWGDNTNGQLGYANVEDIGDDETPAGLEDIEIGGKAEQIVAGEVHTCALLENKKVRCWGRAERPLEEAVGGYGQLGYGNLENIGDDETPASAGDVPIGGPVRSLAAGTVHTCAVLEEGTARCWGRGEGRQEFGQLGYTRNENIGDDETPASVGDIDIGGEVAQIAAADIHTCALLENGKVRCWGFGGFGQLGYGNRDHIGNDEPPAVAGDISVGGPVLQISTGARHTCALLDTDRVVCWGQGASGQLGTGHSGNIGDDETPVDSGPIRL